MRGRTERAWGAPEVAFVLLAYALSWAWWVPLAVTGTTTRAGQGWPTHLPGLLGPAVAAVLVAAATSGRTGLVDLARRVVRWRVGLRWYAAVAAPLALGLLVLVAQALLGQGWPRTEEFATYSGAALMPWVLLVGVVLVVNGFGEEIGWRGFLADRLAPRLGLLRTSLVVAAVWAPWHLPMFWVAESFSEFGPAGTVGWLVSITAGSVVLTWVYLGSGRSIWVAALWHTSFNMVTATAAGGPAAPVVSAAVIVAAVVIARHATGVAAVGGRSSR